MRKQNQMRNSLKKSQLETKIKKKLQRQEKTFAKRNPMKGNISKKATIKKISRRNKLKKQKTTKITI